MEPQTSRRSFLLGAAGASCAAALTLAGCGSGGASGVKKRGEVSAKIVVVWPKETERYIQNNVTLIRVSVDPAGESEGTLYIAHTAGATSDTGIFHKLASGTQFTFTADGYTGYVDGTDTASTYPDTHTAAVNGTATGGGPTTQPGDTILVSLAMNSTVDHLRFTLVDTTDPANYVDVTPTDDGSGNLSVTFPTSSTFDLIVEPVTAAGAVVLTPKGTKFRWSFSQSGYVSLDSLTKAHTAGRILTKPTTGVVMTATYTVPTSETTGFTVRTASLTIVITQAWVEISFTCKQQGTTLQSVVDQFSWTANLAISTTDPATTETIETGPFASGQVVWMKTGSVKFTFPKIPNYTAPDYAPYTGTDTDEVGTTIDKGGTSDTMSTGFVPSVTECYYTLTYTAAAGVNAQVIIS